MAADWTQNVGCMPAVRDYFGMYPGGIRRFSLMTSGPPPYRRLAWVSHRIPLNPEVFEFSSRTINLSILRENRLRARLGQKAWPLFLDSPAASRVVYARQVRSDVEAEVSRRTHNGSNGYYFYVLDRITAP